MPKDIKKKSAPKKRPGPKTPRDIARAARRLPKPTGQRSPPLAEMRTEQLRQLAERVILGAPYSKAYTETFPKRKVTQRSASQMGKMCYLEYKKKHGADLTEMLHLYLGKSPIEKYGEKMNELLDAMTLKNVKVLVESEDEEGHVRHVVLDKTIEVTDNQTRVTALKELGAAVGAHKSEANTAAVIIYRAAEMRKPKGAGRSRHVLVDDDN